MMDTFTRSVPEVATPEPSRLLLTAPYLIPTDSGVEVRWVVGPGVGRTGLRVGRTTIEGPERGAVADPQRFDRVAGEIIEAQTRPLPRLRVEGRGTPRPAGCHVAAVVLPQLTEGGWVYAVQLQPESGPMVEHGWYTIRGTAHLHGRLLLTSDHQGLPNVPANLAAAAATGPVDGVCFAGDFVMVPDRWDDWFDPDHGFFASAEPVLAPLPRGEVPSDVSWSPSQPVLVAALGNHEAMGRWSPDTSLRDQFRDTVPAEIAVAHPRPNAPPPPPSRDAAGSAAWLADHAFNLDTASELLLSTDRAARPWQATTIAGVRILSLFGACAYRPVAPEPAGGGRFIEHPADAEDPARWNGGQHLLGCPGHDPAQRSWLEDELASEAFQDCDLAIAMVHQPVTDVLHHLLVARSDGGEDDNVPPFAPPIRVGGGHASDPPRYRYDAAQDLLRRSILPRLEQAGVSLVLHGHSHLWSRVVRPSGMQILETSNVGNTRVPVDAWSWPAGVDGALDPHRLHIAPGMPGHVAAPTELTLRRSDGVQVPYLANGGLTAFSVLDVAARAVDSYVLEPESGRPPRHFDRAELVRPDRIAGFDAG